MELNIARVLLLLVSDLKCITAILKSTVTTYDKYTKFHKKSFSAKMTSFSIWNSKPDRRDVKTPSH